MTQIPSPKEFYASLAQGVVDQELALEQISVSLYKHMKRIKVGNILLVGNSGSGKTTIMRVIERVFQEDPNLGRLMNCVRLNANIILNDESSDLESSTIIERLIQNAQRRLGSRINEKRFVELVENGVVFLDEIDKIRAVIGDKANPRGILAQEALLTLIEGEKIRVPVAGRDERGALVRRTVVVDTSRILFVCGGAFEGLYDMVYRRVAAGEHRDKLVHEYVVSDTQDDLEEKEHFSLQQYVRYEDMFAYGMTPQFLGRFDEIIVLNDLSIKGLMRIFMEPSDSPFREAKRYFKTIGVELKITRDALRLLAERARENHRLGARALRINFKRVLRGIEFDPQRNASLQLKDGQKVLTLTREIVENHT